MTPVDRMIRTRQQQRDEAARELAAARERLRELEDEQLQLEGRCRSELTQAVGTDGLTLAALETMDASRRWAEVATERTELVVDEAQRVTAELHRLLRQLEILRERASERDRADEGRRERRALDELAARRLRKLLCLAPLLLALGEGNLGCKGSDEAGEKPAEAGVVDAAERDAGSATSQPASRPASQPASRPASSRPAIDAGVRHDAMKFSLAELQQLAALRHRAGQIAKKERELVERERKLAATPAAAPRAVTAAPASQPARPEAPIQDPVVDLIQVLERMPVRNAAAMLAEMSPGLVAAALKHLPAKRVAALLSQMPPDRAGPVAAQLVSKPAPATEDTKTTSGAASPGATTAKPKRETPKTSRSDGGVASNASSKE
jgi:flagellar export protein FliJ